MINRLISISAIILISIFLHVNAGIAKFDGAGVYFFGGGTWSATNDNDFVYFPNSRDTLRTVSKKGKFLFSTEAYLGCSFFYMLAAEFGLNVDIVNPNINLIRQSTQYDGYVTSTRIDSLGVMSYKGLFTRLVIKVPKLDVFFRPFCALHFGRYKEFLGLFSADEQKRQWKINWSAGAYIAPDSPLSFRIDLKHYNYSYTMYKNATKDLNTEVSTYGIAGTIIIQKVAKK